MSAIAPSAKLKDGDFLWRDGPLFCSTALDISQRSGGSSVLLKASEIYEHRLPRAAQGGFNGFYESQRLAYCPDVYVFEIVGGRVYESPAILSACGQYIARDISKNPANFGGPFEEHPLLHQRLLRSMPLPGATMAVPSTASESYYHWLLDELPRLLLPSLPDVDNLVISRPNEQRLKALELIFPHLSFRHSRLIWLNDLMRHVRCESLITTSYLSSSGVPSRIVVERWQAVADQLPLQHIKTPEKFLISRSSADGRYLENEAELMAWLSKKGYERVELENLSWIEQVALFRNAREIVAPHGAGLANLVFCKQQPLVIELFNHSYVHWCFWQLAHLVGADYRPISLPWDAQISHTPAEFKNPIPHLPIVVFESIYRGSFNAY